MTVACFTEEDMESGTRQVSCPSLEVHQQQIPGSNLGPEPLNPHFCPLEAHYSRSGGEISSLGILWKPVRNTESPVVQVHVEGCEAFTRAFPEGNSDSGKSTREIIS